MSIKTISLKEASKQIASMPKEFEADEELDGFVVVEKDEPLLAIMPWDLYEAMMNTMEFMNEMMENLELLDESIDEKSLDNVQSIEELKALFDKSLSSKN